MAKAGRLFEEAVYNFVKLLDPSAKVLFDHKVPDTITKSLRQVDAWIEFLFGGHIPLSILVSCKDEKRKVDISKIGTFGDEVRSTGASTGIIYSHSGFTKTALQKAQAHGFSCCRLYLNEPADLPNMLMLPMFLCRTAVGLRVLTLPTSLHNTTWNELFEIPIKAGDVSKSVLEIIAENFHECEAQRIQESRGKREFPKDWASNIEIGNPDESDRIVIETRGCWKKFRGKIKAHFVNGSYCYSNGNFSGSQIGPAIDTQGSDPGDGWEEMESDASVEFPTNFGLALMLKPDVASALRENLGTSQVPIG